MQFSTRFKQLCKEKGVTQKQALSDMKMGRNSAQSWIDGKPSAEALLKIAEYFDMSTDDVLGVETKKTASQAGSGNEAVFNELFSMLTPEEQEREIAYLRDLVRRRGTPSAD